MTWDALRGWSERGVEIGSHTLSHAHLTQLPDDELRRELVESKAQIEAMLARPCRFLAYPYGEEDARVRAAARDAGYVAAFGLPGANPIDQFSFPRVGLYAADGTLRTAAKLTPPLRHAATALRRRLSRG
jgi:peptidoglycan/xylan/chitin deacetylase (PgdA/CDA1 family)